MKWVWHRVGLVRQKLPWYSIQHNTERPQAYPHLTFSQKVICSRKHFKSLHLFLLQSPPKMGVVIHPPLTSTHAGQRSGTHWLDSGPCTQQGRAPPVAVCQPPALWPLLMRLEAGRCWHQTAASKQAPGPAVLHAHRQEEASCRCYHDNPWVNALMSFWLLLFFWFVHIQ